jgi:hypothetical protein
MKNSGSKAQTSFESTMRRWRAPGSERGASFWDVAILARKNLLLAGEPQLSDEGPPEPHRTLDNIWFQEVNILAHDSFAPISAWSFCSSASNLPSGKRNMLSNRGSQSFSGQPLLHNGCHVRASSNKRSISSYAQNRLSPTTKPSLFNQGCICSLRFATQQCNLYG